MAIWRYQTKPQIKAMTPKNKHRVIRKDCRGFNKLPPRSPEATPCDFFLWCYVKDQA